MNIEKQYLELLSYIYFNGIRKQATRDGAEVQNGTIGIPHCMIQHDMRVGFPLMTHRKLPYKSVMVELEGFIKGITDKSWYQERGCNFWNEWSNPNSEDENDLGPIYGYQWVNFGEQYGETYHFSRETGNRNGIDHGYNQLEDILYKLRYSPYDRRMVCSAWNPNQTDSMALPPCHFMFNVVVYGDTLNLCWGQRSVDTVLGLPANIASYATLMLLLCEHTSGYTNLKPGILTGFLCDVHIYDNQFKVVEEIMTRSGRELPEIEFTHGYNLQDWTHKDVRIKNYNPLPKIDTKGLITV